ncbi:P-loop containing nucleoside triphosphate hydrolase protein [Mycena vulgaris]|nr:P-loop containing nucleoside triphosphate hydrolase protein [Mycena vulgaris]
MNQWCIALLGDGAVGKTALAVQVCRDTLPNWPSQTWEPSMKNIYRRLYTVDNRPCGIEVLDMTGLEEYAALREQCLIPPSQGFFLVYSVTSRESFDSIQALWHLIRRIKQENPPVILLANKCDKGLERQVSPEEGAALAHGFGFPFLEISAKSTLNVDRAFVDLVRLLRTKGANRERNCLKKRRPFRSVRYHLS